MDSVKVNRAATLHGGIRGKKGTNKEEFQYSLLI